MALHIVLNGEKSMEEIQKEINTRIDNEEIRTWAYDEDKDYTQRNTQWAHDAWMRVYPESDGVANVGLIGRKDDKMSKELYSIYHTRFSEMLLTLFDEYIDRIEMTSMQEMEVDNFD